VNASIVSRFGVELEGRDIKPPKLRREGKLALSIIELIGLSLGIQVVVYY
jgi:hypothetical protein